jgi:SAM-dependent methyltransferase
MSNAVFRQEYADQYDLLYHDKDYEAECDLLEEVFRRYGSGPVKTILDLGCGTGNHALPLARRGYQVTGIDLSEEMLAHARRKAQANLPPDTRHCPAFRQGDVRTLDLGQQFDAVLMMFAVLGYQLTNNDVLAALRTTRRHLRPGGLFVCDVWYGPAVLAIRPSDRVKVIPTDDGKVVRAVSGQLDTYRHLCQVRYQVWRLSAGRLVSESEETHWMRYFFPQELALFTIQEQIQLVDIRSFGDSMRLPDDTTWNIIVIGRSLG